MQLIGALGAIFGWAFFSFWSAIPAGIALQVAPVVVAATVTLSYASGVALVVVAGVPLRQRIQRRFLKSDADFLSADSSNNRGLRWAQLAWQRFGLVGLALLAPMTLGSQIGAVIGLALGARPLPLLIAMTLGAGVWALLITAAVVMGVMVVT
jgi:hypothetical protein